MGKMGRKGADERGQVGNSATRNSCSKKWAPTKYGEKKKKYITRKKTYYSNTWGGGDGETRV